MTDEWQVLIIEDETDSLEMVCQLLEYAGVTCIPAATAEEALQTLARMTPTLIVTDLALPGMDGWSLLRELQAHPVWATIPRVAITAYHSVELAERAIDEGFDAYFAKPLDATTFVADLQDIVEG